MRVAVGKGWILTVEMALERVGLGPVVLAPKRRFMLFVCLNIWRLPNSRGVVHESSCAVKCLPAHTIKLEC